MDKLLIEGGRPLEGRVTISGAKNAALPAVAAALLTDQRVVLRNVPRVRDITTMRSLLEELGVDSSLTHEEHGNRVEIEARRLINPVAPAALRNPRFFIAFPFALRSARARMLRKWHASRFP